jgi:heme/copper-type cytochrome/quinol oxidase subunit 3
MTVKHKSLDVSGLPTLVFGHRDPLWWGVLLSIAIEGSMLVLMMISYFYVQDRVDPWPLDLPARTIAIIATIEVAVWLISCWPMHVASKSAIEDDMRGMKIGMVASTALGVVAAVLRGIEFSMLPFRWDANAYASCVYGLLVIQSTHIVTGLFENGFFTAILYRGPMEPKHRADIEVGAPLWYFVTAGAVLCWAVIFLQILLTRQP